MRHKAALDDFVVELEHESFFFLVPEFFNERDEVLSVNLAGVQWHASRQIGDADNFHAVAVNHLVVGNAFDIAAGFHGKINDNAAGLHGIEHFGGDENRRLAAEHLRGGNHHV